MARCSFCTREFESPQGAKAHLRWCPDYLDLKKNPVRQNRRGDSLSKLSPSQPSGSHGPQETSPAPNPFQPLVDQMTQSFAGPDEATRRKQKRDALLTSLCSSLIDWYRPLKGVVTQEMAVMAKVAILDELGALPIDEFPQTELTLRGTAIRNRVFAPYFQRQHEQDERQQEARRRDALRLQEDTATQARRATRKAALLELGVARALQSATAHDFPLQAVTVLEWEVRARLEVLVVGDETDAQVEETIAAAIERPLLEWAARVEQARNASRERVMTHCLATLAPAFEAAWPWMKEVAFKTLCERFGVPPTPPQTEPTTSDASSASGAPDEPSSDPIQPKSPDARSTESVTQEEPEASEPPVNRAAMS
jgi:hypothetical protein